MITTKWFTGYDDLSDAHYIRRKVFIEEQGVSEEDEMLDGTDEGSIHLVVYDSNFGAVATGRFLIDENGNGVIGRVAVLKEHRKKRLGDLVMRQLIRKLFDAGKTKQYIHSQITAKGFYEKLGFVAFGQQYIEAGIPHINMVHEGDVLGSCG